MKNSNTSDLKSFNYLENGEITFSILDTIKTTKVLDSGSYKLSWLDYPANRVCMKKDIDSEVSKIHAFPDKPKIDSLITSFFDKKVVDLVKHIGFYHKMGLLFHGKEGTGKTTIVKHYYNRLIEEKNALVFHIDRSDYHVKDIWEFVVQVRQIQTNPIVIVFDEFDQMMRECEAFLKTVLDGNMSINNCLFMASTNYLEKIPKAMKDRPSRFKYTIEIKGIDNLEDVLPIVHSMLSSLFSFEEVKEFSDKLKGETLDTIKQFCLDKIMNLENYRPGKTKIGF